MKRFSISEKVTVGEGSPLLLIAGPCQLESRDHALLIGSQVKKLADRYGFSFVFKSSFDKANRTKLDSTRGIGLEAGLRILAEVGRELGVPVTTDVHEVSQVAAAAEVIDVLQIPAFLCRQTDLLVAAGKTGRTVTIKKGQFLPPADMAWSAEKVAHGGSSKILLCERGTCFGYRDLIVDPRSLVIMRGLGYPVVFDATHSVQQMGGLGGSSGGLREFIPPLTRAAVAVGIDALFFECHDDPARAPSDGATMIPMSDVDHYLAMVHRCQAALLQTGKVQ